MTRMGKFLAVVVISVVVMLKIIGVLNVSAADCDDDYCAVFGTSGLEATFFSYADSFNVVNKTGMTIEIRGQEYAVGNGRFATIELTADNYICRADGIAQLLIVWRPEGIKQWNGAAFQFPYCTDYPPPAQ